MPDEDRRLSVFISWAGEQVRSAGVVGSLGGIGVRQLRVPLGYLETFGVDGRIERLGSWVTAQFLRTSETR